MEDIEILENMRDEIYGAMQFEDDYQVSELEEEQFNALNLAIKALKERQADKEKIKELKAVNKMQEYRINEMDIPKAKIIENRDKTHKEYIEAMDKNPTKAFILKCKLEAYDELLKDGGE